MEKLKASKVAGALDAKKVAKLSPPKKRHLAGLKQEHQIDNFLIAGTPEPNPMSLMEQLKASKVAGAFDAKNVAKLCPPKKRHLADLKQEKEGYNFLMLNAPETKKRKGKTREEDTKVWFPCPLLPGIPTVPPPRIPQPWELRDATEEMRPLLQAVNPGLSMAESEIDRTEIRPIVNRTPPQKNLLSIIEKLKASKVARALDAKIVAKLSPAKKKHLTELKQKKEVGNFMMPDAPEPKKRKGKTREEDTKVWFPCPLLPGIPTVPPPRIPQPWELRDATEEMPILQVVTPGVSMAESEIDRTEVRPIVDRTPPQKNPISLVEQRKASKVARASNAKNVAKFSPVKKKHLAELKQEKQVGNFMMSDAPEPKKIKEKTREEDTQVSVSCPLLPGVSTDPPPRIPQPWELRDATEEMPILQVVTPGVSMAELEIDRTEIRPTVDRTPPQKNPISLMAQLKDSKAASVSDAKNVAKLSPAKKTHLAELKQEKQVDNFMMPDATEPKKIKEKTREEDTQVSVSCPLLPGVPTDPPPRIPQPWELRDATEEMPMLQVVTPGVTMAESETDRTEICPIVDRTPARKKLTLPQFCPSTGIINVTELPQNPLVAEIELVGFTPSSATLITVPGTGMGAYEFEADVGVERQFIEPGDGSDYDPDEDLGDFSVPPRTVNEYPVDCDDLADPSLAEALSSIDADADCALRTAIGPEHDFLDFDWRCEPENFQGVREAFTVISGPTFDNKELTPSSVFFKIWDANIIALIVRETNRYGDEILKRNEKPKSRISRWKHVTENEILTFFAIVMLQSLVVNNVEREYWYPKLKELIIGDFKAIMPYNRFLQIKRCLHFVDNASLFEHPNRLCKILPIIEHLNQAFSSLYTLEQNVAIDESLLLWKGRLSFSQKIATKRARVGIKSYELCESRTGYMWKMEVYSGKGHVHEQEPVVEQHPHALQPGHELENSTSQIVLNLMRPLFNRGHTLVMDNFYNAPLLSRILKEKHKTDSMGTLRLNREFVPESLKKKAKSNMKTGEVAFSTTKDLSVVVWMDKNVVSMISSYHEVKVGGKEKYGYYKYKPQVILDYNLSMGGIDHKDQMLHSYPVERVRNSIWYKKLFRRLINVSIHNAFVMFNHNRTKSLPNRDFRLQLAKELLQIGTPRPVPQPLRVAPEVEQPAPSATSQMHLPMKNQQQQRCKLCHAAKVRRTTMWRCSSCDVNLCIEGCYTKYHIANLE